MKVRESAFLTEELGLRSQGGLLLEWGLRAPGT
jgi:hypothetical protein